MQKARFFLLEIYISRDRNKFSHSEYSIVYGCILKLSIKYYYKEVHSGFNATPKNGITFKPLDRF